LVSAIFASKEVSLCNPEVISLGNGGILLLLNTVRLKVLGNN
jgi:hypothetical protein